MPLIRTIIWMKYDHHGSDDTIHAGTNLGPRALFEAIKPIYFRLYARAPFLSLT